jgi:hypothetical protein
MEFHRIAGTASLLPTTLPSWDGLNINIGLVVKKKVIYCIFSLIAAIFVASLGGCAIVKNGFAPREYPKKATMESQAESAAAMLYGKYEVVDSKRNLKKIDSVTLEFNSGYPTLALYSGAKMVESLSVLQCIGAPSFEPDKAFLACSNEWYDNIRPAHFMFWFETDGKVKVGGLIGEKLVIKNAYHLTYRHFDGPEQHFAVRKVK